MRKNELEDLPYRAKVTLAKVYRWLISQGYTPGPMRAFLAKKARELEEKTGIPHMVYGIDIIPLHGDLRDRRFKKLVEHALRLLDKWIRTGERSEQSVIADMARENKHIPRFFDTWVKNKGRGYDIPRVDMKELEKWRKRHGRKAKRKKRKKIKIKR